MICKNDYPKASGVGAGIIFPLGNELAIPSNVSSSAFLPNGIVYIFVFLIISKSSTNFLIPDTGRPAYPSDIKYKTIF